MGGISIVISLAFWLFVDRQASLVTVSQIAFTLAFVCNHPHFLSSYVMLYGDYQDRLITRPAYAWAGIVAPVLVAGAIGTALLTAGAALMAQVITLMYFLVGWHYVKQIFGCVIVTSAQRQIFFTKGERRLLLGNLFLAWFMSWLSFHVGNGSYEFYGIRHQSLNLPPALLTAVYAGVALSLAAVIYSQINRFVRTGQKPSPPAVVAYVSLYVWYLPTLTHPSFGYLIPFFHSLQYLAFVGRLKRNQADAAVAHLDGPAQRREWLSHLGSFAFLALGLGALAFEFVPKFLDRHQLISAVGLGSSPILAAVILFINIHHYFIDNVIWKGDNETVRQHLFGPATGVPPAEVVRF